MSVSKKHLLNAAICSDAVSRYRAGVTKGKICQDLKITPATVQKIIENHITAEEIGNLKKNNYSLPKLGKKNPRFGKRPGNYVGVCDDHKGYYTKVEEKKRHFYHRLVFAEMLGIQIAALPRFLEVHHIDKNPKNNSGDNLALVTRAGHAAIHAQLRRIEMTASPITEERSPSSTADLLKRKRGPITPFSKRLIRRR